MSYYNLIIPDFIKALELDNPINKRTKDVYSGINCPECNHKESFVHIDTGFLRCNRVNKCGAVISPQKQYPYLFKDIAVRFPSTPANPLAPQIAYLSSRGLDHTKINFSAGRGFSIEGKNYPSIAFIQDGVKQERLIDYHGKDKNRLTEYSGKVWKTAGVDSSTLVFVTEGIFNAESLAQSGFPAIATYSSGSIPAKYFEVNKSKEYVIAFDNDKAGRKGTDKLVSLFTELSIKYSVAMSPRGKDWNDLLVDGSLNQKAIDKAYWQGRLELATNANDYFEIYLTHHTNTNFKIFEFNLNTYLGRRSEKKGDLSIKQIADCSIKLLHSTIDNSDTERQKMTHHIQIESNREGVSRFSLDANEITRIDSFKSAIAQHRQIFSGSSDDLNFLASYLYSQNPPKLRALSVIGFDESSRWFVFDKFAYSNKGERVAVNKDGFFDKAGIRPFNNFSDNIIKNYETLNSADLITLIDNVFGAYGNKGLLALGFYVSTTYSHDIFKELSFFPFLSLYGSPHSGKSGLSLLLNRINFIDGEGHSMSKTNTSKGELRKIGQGSSIVRALLEGRKDSTRFDYDSILPLYNRNSLYTRATTSQDNRTHDLPLQAALSFVWNQECFTLKAAKERVVSILFSDDEITETSGISWTKLQEYSPEQLAGVGHHILSNRNHFEQNLIPEVRKLSTALKGSGISVSRIADNHAIALAGITTLLDLLCVDKFNESLFEFTTATAAKKMETAKTDNHLADIFLDTIKELNLITIDGDEFYFNLTNVLIQLSNRNSAFHNKKELIESLRTHDDYVNSNVLRRMADTGNPSKCYVFRLRRTNGFIS